MGWLGYADLLRRIICNAKGAPSLIFLYTFYVVLLCLQATCFSLIFSHDFNPLAPVILSRICFTNAEVTK